MKLQMLFCCTTNLNWIPSKIWTKSNIFSPCLWYEVADAFLLYAQTKLDTSKTLTQIWYLFAMPLIWSCWCFLVDARPKLDTLKDFMQIRYVFALPLIWIWRCIFVVRSTYIGNPQDSDTIPIFFRHTLDMELQTLFGHTLNLTWKPPRLLHISGIFQPCP